MLKLKFDSTIDLSIQVRKQRPAAGSILNRLPTAFLADDIKSHSTGNSASNGEKICWNSLVSLHQFENLSVVTWELNLGADKLKGRRNDQLRDRNKEPNKRGFYA